MMSLLRDDHLAGVAFALVVEVGERGVDVHQLLCLLVVHDNLDGSFLVSIEHGSDS